MLEDAEEELLRLQEAQDKSGTELESLRKKEGGLTTKKEAADKELKEDAENATLKTTLQQAKDELEINANKIKAREREQASLEKQIGRQQKFIATLEEAFTAAAQATIRSRAGGTATFGDAGSGSNRSSVSGVANAVRAITLNAINQDYEAQVCFETLRYRNNLGQFRNDVNNAFDSAGLPERLAGDAFLEYCRSLFGMQADLRSARVGLVETYASAIQTVIDKVGMKNDNISAKDAVALILVLSEAVPTEPGAAFLKRKLEVEGAERRETNGSGMMNNTQNPGNAVLAETLQRLQASGLSSKDMDIVVPTTMTTTATVGAPRVVLSCDLGRKPNSEGKECVDRCDGDDVQYDKDSDECVPVPKPAAQSKGK